MTSLLATAPFFHTIMKYRLEYLSYLHKEYAEASKSITQEQKHTLSLTPWNLKKQRSTER